MTCNVLGNNRIHKFNIKILIKIFKWTDAKFYIWSKYCMEYMYVKHLHKKLLTKKIQNTVNSSQGRSLFQPHIYNNFFLPGINNSWLSTTQEIYNCNLDQQYITISISHELRNIFYNFSTFWGIYLVFTTWLWKDHISIVYLQKVYEFMYISVINFNPKSHICKYQQYLGWNIT